MTTKLTLSIDQAVISSAKKYAQKEKRSLSDIVENYLMTLTAKDQSDNTISPGVLKLKGAAGDSEIRDYKKELSRSLAKKYRV